MTLLRSDDKIINSKTAGFADENVSPSGANNSAHNEKVFGNNGFSNDFGGGDNVAPSGNDDNRCRK